MKNNGAWGAERRCQRAQLRRLIVIIVVTNPVPQENAEISFLSKDSGKMWAKYSRVAGGFRTLEVSTGELNRILSGKQWHIFRTR
jgi:hypothetical protein